MIYPRRLFVNFGLVLVLVIGEILLSADIESQSQYQWPELKLDEFASVEYPDQFSITDNLIWGTKAIFNHKDVANIVPVYAYERSRICADEQLEEIVGLGALEFHVRHNGTNEATEVEVTTAWNNSWSGICSVQNSKDSKSFVSIDVEGANQSVRSEVARDLIETSQVTDSADYVLMYGNLPSVDPVRHYWFQCNDDRAAAQEPISICDETLLLSAHSQ